MVVLLQVRADGQKHVTRFTHDPIFKKHFLPLTVKLGLRQLPSALQGLRVLPPDIPALRDEFARLRQHVSDLWFTKPKWIKKHVLSACDAAVTALDAAADDLATQLFLVSSYRPEQATGLKPFDFETLRPLGEPVDVMPCLRELYSLTSLSGWEAAVERCESFGWDVDEDNREAGYVWFRPGDGLRLFVDNGVASGHPFAYVVVHCASELGPEMAEFYPSGRSDYDGAFERTKSKIERVFGEPATRGEYVQRRKRNGEGRGEMVASYQRVRPPLARPWPDRAALARWPTLATDPQL